MKIREFVLSLSLATSGLALIGQHPSALTRLDLMQTIQSKLKMEPQLAVRAAEEGLRMGGPLDLEDFEHARELPLALDLAHQGMNEAPSGSPQSILFKALEAWAQQANGKAAEGRESLERSEAQINALSTSPQPESRYQAAQALRTLGAANLRMRRLPEAMESFTRALSLYDGLNDARGRSRCQASMGMVHFLSGRYEDAVGLVKEAIATAKAGKVMDGLSGYNLSLGHYYAHIPGKTGEEFLALQAAREAAIEEGNDFNLAVVATNLADVALQQKNYKATLKYAEEAIPLVQGDDQVSLATCWVNKGIALNRLRRPGGIAFIQKAADTFSSIGDREDLAEVQGVLADEYAFNGEYEKAYRAQSAFKNQTDRLRGEADQRRIAEAETAYRSDLQRRQIEELQKRQALDRKLRWLWILAVTSALSAVILLITGRVRLKRANRKLEDLSLHDPLTGLANRRHLTSRVEEDLAQIRRMHHSALDSPSNADAIFMMLDLDRFKAINDRHGHAAGDEVLREFSKILLRELRDSDTVTRWGGEEFLVLAKHANRKDAGLLTERIREAVALHRFDLPDGSPLHCTCSIGFACYPFLPFGVSSPPWTQLVSLADECLYAAKAGGRNMWVGLLPEVSLREAIPPDLSAKAGLARGLFKLIQSDGREAVWPG